ncbi:MAG: glycosyltransferase family 2 protein [Elusimicrobia bacterium]|nr:glycosyltransferase family 2 protein [Elusimicrobiota bacterium]
MLQQRLEIIIPTYNRKSYLKRTLSQLTEEESPVKGLSITVLDNASTDGTGELVEAFAARFPNIKHIRHNKNIGGNANIARAFELAQKEYFWVLSDDDDFDFSAWNEVEQAIAEKKALIVVNRELLPDNQTIFQAGELVRLLTFCPAAIHRSDTITSEVLINIYYNTANWFPHLGAVCAAINKRLPIQVLSKNIVLCGKNDNHLGLEFHRKTPGIAFPYRMRFFEVCYLKSLAMIDDNKIRTQAVANFSGRRKLFFSAVQSSFKKNMVEYGHNLQNYTAPLQSLSPRQQVCYIAALVWNYVLFLTLYPKFWCKRKKFMKRLVEANGNK